MRIQTLDELREEAQISQRLWVKVLGMLEQNWCVIEEGPGGGVELVFFDDHGKVFDHLPAANLHAAQAALQTNGFYWMWELSSFIPGLWRTNLATSGCSQAKPSGLFKRRILASATSQVDA